MRELTAIQQFALNSALANNQIKPENLAFLLQCLEPSQQEGALEVLLDLAKRPKELDMELYWLHKYDSRDWFAYKANLSDYNPVTKKVRVSYKKYKTRYCKLSFRKDTTDCREAAEKLFSLTTTSQSEHAVRYDCQEYKWSGYLPYGDFEIESRIVSIYSLLDYVSKADQVDWSDYRKIEDE